MPPATIEFFVLVDAGDGADDEELDDLARQLANELAELDTVSTELPKGNELPPRAKGVTAAIGTILVKIADVGGITALVTLVESWLSRDERRALTLQIGENKLKVTHISKAEQTRLIRWFQTQTGLRLEV